MNVTVHDEKALEAIEMEIHDWDTRETRPHEDN